MIHFLKSRNNILNSKSNVNTLSKLLHLHNFNKSKRKLIFSNMKLDINYSCKKKCCNYTKSYKTCTNKIYFKFIYMKLNHTQEQLKESKYFLNVVIYSNFFDHVMAYDVYLSLLF